jgi:hypothetical protein
MMKASRCRRCTAEACEAGGICLAAVGDHLKDGGSGASSCGGAGFVGGVGVQEAACGSCCSSRCMGQLV